MKLEMWATSLHEVAHIQEDSTGFEDDADDPLMTKTELNNQLSQKNCSKTLGVAKP